MDGYGCTQFDDKAEFYRLCAVDAQHEHIRCAYDTAKNYGMHIVFGYSKRDGADMRIRNAALFINDKGERIGEYYKHDCPKTDQDRVFEQGEDVPAFDTGFGKLGILICRDRRVRENYEALKKQEVRAVLIPSYGFFGSRNDEILSAFAAEFELTLLFSHPSESVIFGSDGSVLARYCGNVPDICLYDVILR